LPVAKFPSYPCGRMGLYYDYFRARDAKRAKAIADAGYIGKTKDVDLLSLRGMDAEVRIGSLLAFALGAEWTVNTVQSTAVWPPEPRPRTPDDFDRLPENSPWFTSDYQLDEFAPEFRDALATLSEPQLRRLETDWTPTAAFDDYDLDLVRSDFRALVDLARRAHSVGDKLFLISPV